ncbi:MAG: hypothetical protein M1838_001545 [Thelocarpon superellum]|nr:MAG: hypothetical protein M1838_001545 [Thelocarpon superellum]
MVKSYLKFEHTRTFGLINSASANVIWNPTHDGPDHHTRRTGAGCAVVPANEEVLCWDLKKGELLSRWRDKDCTSQVSALARSHVDQDIFAVGHEDGSIRLWDAKVATVLVSFNGHRSAITTLAFDQSGTRLASGAKDTDIIVWDLVAEVGLFKLRGHKDQITSLAFIKPTPPLSEGESNTEPAMITASDEHGGFLLSTGKDALIKLWDLQSPHCMETHVAQSNGECWALGVSPDGSGCVTAGNEGELKVWSIDVAGLGKATQQLHVPSSTKFLHERGRLLRQGRDRTLGVTFHPTADFFAVHGAEKMIEIWRIRAEAEVRKTLARKRKRKREKTVGPGEQAVHVPEETVNGLDQFDTTAVGDIADVFVSYVVVRTGGKMRAVDWAGGNARHSLRLLAATTNNQLEVYQIPTSTRKHEGSPDEAPEYSRILSVDMPGHRADVRSLSLSHDDLMLASASNGSLKVWSVKTGVCIRTFECGYALCCAFLPGDKIVSVGTKSGSLELFDVASSTMIDTMPAHEGAVWAMQIHPDGRSMVTGGADQSAKFWKFDVVQEEIPGTKRTTPRLKLLHTRTLKVSDDILSLRFSPDARLLALALLDNTVKVFFVDTLKLFLNLYGHKLPVLHMDISWDSKLIVTCSADKNVRLWGLDFGDCHKALFAHQDSIMQVAFIPQNQDGDGHNFFSASKDRMIKYWDGDKFAQIQKLDGHHGEVWALAISRRGDFLVSASHDKSVRVWEQADEQIFLEEEREKELEQLYERTLTTSLEQDDEAGEDVDEVVDAGKQTVSTLMAGEKIAEALELGMADLEAMRAWTVAKDTQPLLGAPTRHPQYLALNNISAEAYLLSTLQKIPAAALQDALLVLPFAAVPKLFAFLNIFAQRAMNMPLTCRILTFMLKTHHKQIVASKMMRPMLEEVRGSVRTALSTQKNMLGYNLAALRVIGMRAREAAERDFVDDDLEREQAVVNESMTRKRGFVDVA